MKEKKSKRKQYIKYTVLIIFSIIQIFPLIWTLLFSFKSNKDIVLNGALSLPKKWMFSNYYDAWIKGHIQDYFLNSVVVTTITLIVVLVLGSMAAYGLTRMNWRLSKLVMVLILSGIMIPIQAILIPEFYIMSRLQLTRTYLAVIIPYIGTGLPLCIYIVSGFLKSIPKEVEEAAFIDGCGIFRSFFLIVTNLIKPALATVGVFTFLNAWNEFIMASTFIYNDSLKTLPLGLMSFQGTHAVDWGPMGAAMVIASVPTLLFYLKFSNMIEHSFSAGEILK
ncbi:carbohydrate ABC transporter permease [Vallitalea sediminicola]